MVDYAKMLLAACVVALVILCILGPCLAQKRTDDVTPGGPTSTTGKAVATVEAKAAPMLATVEAWEDGIDEQYAKAELEFCLKCCEVSPLLVQEGVAGCQAVCYSQ